MVVYTFIYLKCAELSLPYIGSWLGAGVDAKLGCRKINPLGRTSCLPFIVTLCNDPNPKRQQNVQVKNLKSCRMNQKAQKNTQEKKDIFSKNGQ